MSKQLPKSDLFPGRGADLIQFLVRGGLLAVILWFIEFLFLCRFYDINSLLWHHRIEIIIANILGTGSAYFIAGVLAALVVWTISYGCSRKNSNRSNLICTILSSGILSLVIIIYLRFWLFGHLRITYHKVYFYLNLGFIFIGLLLSAFIFIGVKFFSPKGDRSSFFGALSIFLGYYFIFGSHNNLMLYRFRKASGLPRFSSEVLLANAAFLLIAFLIGLLSWFFFRRFIPRLKRLKPGTAWTILGICTLIGVLANGFFYDRWSKYIVQNPLLRNSVLSPGTPRPNIILIIMDALRADHLGCYGYRRDTSPFIDSLVEKGVIFNNYNSSTNFTFPFLNTFLSGSGYRKYFSQEHIRKPPRHIPLLPELLRPAGYRSAAFIPLELSERRDPGFTLFRRLGIGGELPESALEDTTFTNAFKNAFDAYSTSITFSRQFWLYKLVERFFEFRTPMYLVRSDRFSTFCRRALSWVGKEPETPFFIYLHPRGAHHPYFPPLDADRKFFHGRFPEDAERANSLYSLSIVLKKRPSPEVLDEIINLYDDGIVYLDTTMKWFWGELERKGWLENTLIIISADHGESFFEHGTGLHHSSLYQEEIHVPMIVLWKDHVSPGLRLDGSFSALDVCPSLLEAAGVAMPEEMPGSSFLGYLSGGEKVPQKKTSFSEDAWQGWRDVISAQRFPWKIIAYINNGHIDKTEIYNLADDPGERQELGSQALDQPDVGEMREQIREYIKEYPLNDTCLNGETAIKDLGDI